jgi:long-chain acyl-CoA synthetase
MAFVLGTTIAQVFIERVRKSPGTVAFRYRSSNDVVAPRGEWRDVTFHTFKQECEQASLGLKAAGITRGDHVAILSKTRYEWTLADLAIIGAGAITVPIYPSSTESETIHLLQHSEAKAVFIEDESQLMKLIPHLEKIPLLKKIVLLESDRTHHPAGVTPFFQLLNEGEAERHHSPNYFEDTLRAIQPSDLFTISYTSGTTGTPKGVMLSHENLMSVLRDSANAYGQHIREGKEVLLTFLPFSHIIGRLESMSPFVFGWQLNFADSIEKLPENLKEIRPTILFTVPRIFEKALNEVENRVDRSSIVLRGIYRLAMSTGESYFGKKRRGKRPGIIRRASYDLFREAVLARVLEAFGGRLRFAVCGGAPLSKEVGETFEILGILILEGYGLTETCAPVTLNTVEAHRFGTVGRPLSDVTVKIADDGEILLRSQKVFSGYWKDESESRDAFDEDGWYRTGDIGFVDPQGYLHITDRKKDLIITSGGKNIAPQKIETMAKALSPLIADFVVVGDRQKHLAALITLDRKALDRFARSSNILYSDLGEFTKHHQVQAEIGRIIKVLNDDLARYETIKKFAILPDLFSIESGELTPSMKVKRPVIGRKYSALINALYQDPSTGS